jgi:uncharacterized YccA/Bax inhibitor family protein
MAMLRTGNPTLRAETFSSVVRARGEEAMTLAGTVNKTGVSLLILVAFAAMAWNGVLGGAYMPLLWLGLGGGFVLALVTVSKKEWAPFTTPLYAAFEGVFLGVVSLFFNAAYPGIVFNAVGLTFGVLAALLAAYSSGLIRPSENVKLGIVAATGGIGLVYLVSIGLSFFGKSIPLIHGSGPIGIGFSLLVVGIAALNLVLDFDFIETGAQRGAPKYMEWYGAFGLLVTLVWLYLEILRLLAKLQGKGRR